MKDIAVLIDYSEGCKVALNQSRILSELSGARIHALNVTNERDEGVEHLMLASFVTEVIGASIPLTTHVYSGSLVKALTEGLRSICPDLVVLCTHGIQGIQQKLFGARVLSLVQSQALPFLVVQENSKVDEEGFRKILFPATHSPKAEVMIEQVVRLAAECDSEVVFYEIDKYLLEAEFEIKMNFEKAKKLCKSKGIVYSHVKEQPNTRSLGFARQTLDYAAANGINLIATLSEVMDTGFLMLKSDKELLLTNEKGIPVLACG